MAKEQLRYDKMVETALRGVVRDALRQAADRGLPANHHFYITFRTQYPGVDIPDYLAAQYTNEMTIVIQYQYYGLEVDNDRFTVTLSFNNTHERLEIPLAAISTFADPSVNFALQFQPVPPPVADTAEIAQLSHPPAKEEVEPAPSTEESPPKRGEVVTLDAFRKK